MLKYLDCLIFVNEYVSSEIILSGYLFLLFFFLMFSMRWIDCKYNGFEVCFFSLVYLMGYDVFVFVYVELKEVNVGID